MPSICDPRLLLPWPHVLRKKRCRTVRPTSNCKSFLLSTGTLVKTSERPSSLPSGTRRWNRHPWILFWLLTDCFIVPILVPVSTGSLLLDDLKRTALSFLSVTYILPSSF